MYFMNMFKKRDLLYLTLVLIILKIPLGLLYAQDSFNATMTVEANIMGFAEVLEALKFFIKVVPVKLCVPVHA